MGGQTLETEEELTPPFSKGGCIKPESRGGIHRGFSTGIWDTLPHCHRPRQLAGAFSGTFENHSVFQGAVGNDHLGYFRLRPQGLFSSSSWSSPSLFSQSSPSRPVSSNVHVKHLYSQNIYRGSIFLSKPTPI